MRRCLGSHPTSYGSIEVQLRKTFYARQKPYWSGTAPSGEPIGILREDFVEELFIWRPILEGLVTITEVKSGDVDIIDLLKLNALMDMRAAAEAREYERARSAK